MISIPLALFVVLTILAVIGINLTIFVLCVFIFIKRKERQLEALEEDDDSEGKYIS